MFKVKFMYLISFLLFLPYNIVAQDIIHEKLLKSTSLPTLIQKPYWCDGCTKYCAQGAYCRTQQVFDRRSIESVPRITIERPTSFTVEDGRNDVQEYRIRNCGSLPIPKQNFKFDETRSDLIRITNNYDFLGIERSATGRIDITFLSEFLNIKEGGKIKKVLNHDFTPLSLYEYTHDFTEERSIVLPEIKSKTELLVFVTPSWKKTTNDIKSKAVVNARWLWQRRLSPDFKKVYQPDPHVRLGMVSYLPQFNPVSKQTFDINLTIEGFAARIGRIKVEEKAITCAAGDSNIESSNVKKVINNTTFQ